MLTNLSMLCRCVPYGDPLPPFNKKLAFDAGPANMKSVSVQKSSLHFENLLMQGTGRSETAVIHLETFLSSKSVILFMLSI